MIKYYVCVFLSLTVIAETDTPVEISPKPQTISVQEMLIIGHPQLKMHSLAMIMQNKIKGGVDETYLPGFKVCAENPAEPIRSITAQLLAQHFVQDKEEPNAEAFSLLKKLADDTSPDVRYSAIYYGLTQVRHKSPELVEQLIDIAAINRNESLLERIITSLKNRKPQVIRILNEKLEKTGNIAIYEIYKAFTGKKPADNEKYLNMLSSRPRLYIIKSKNLDNEAAKVELEKILTDADIKNPELKISKAGGEPEPTILMLTTYITRDQQTVESVLSDMDQYRIIQKIWLTSELESQINSAY